jgi:hypothetical protein
LMGTDEGKKLRPRIGSACRSAIHRGLRFVPRMPIELSTLDYFLLGASYRESRDQREDENGRDHEEQFHVIPLFVRRQRNERTTYDAVPGTRWIIGLLVIVPLWNCKSGGGATGHEKAAATPRLSSSRLRCFITSQRASAGRSLARSVSGKSRHRADPRNSSVRTPHIRPQRTCRTCRRNSSGNS